MINLSLLDHFYPVTSHRRVQKKKKATDYCVRSLVTVRNQLPGATNEDTLEILQSQAHLYGQRRIFARNQIRKRTIVSENLLHDLSFFFLFAKCVLELIEIEYAVSAFENETKAGCLQRHSVERV